MGFECSTVLAACEKALSPNIEFKNISSDIVESINTNHEKIIKDIGYARGIIEKKLKDKIDTLTASKIVLESYWAGIPISQKKKFNRIFKTFLLRQSSSAIATVLVDSNDKLDKDTIKLDKYTQLSDDAGILKSRVYTNETYVVVYKIHCVKSKSGSKWKVYDVVIDGVSILKQYTSEFRRKMESSGLDELIALMKKVNTKLAPPAEK